MESAKYYLKQNVLMEPLFNQWYAWSHLIAPASAAMNVANLHIKIMKSYIAAPLVHANAVKNPAMLGGPFIDYEGGRVAEIKALLDKTIKEQAHMIEFAMSVQALDNLLRNEAKGLSLEPLYAKMPENLKSFVELVYDLNNNPSMRFVEGLLYKSPYYNPSSQSIALSLIFQDDRAFALSTPRLANPKVLQLNLPFSHPGVDELFRMKTAPQSIGYISECLGLAKDEVELFTTFLTEEPPPPPPRYDGNGVKIRYYGHACVSVETEDLCILIDPVISYAYDNGIVRYTFRDLPDKIDYVLITHGHQDHVMFESLLQLRHRIQTLILPRSRAGCLQDPSLKMIFKNIGFKDVREIDELEQIDLPGGSITGMPFFGEHADLNIGSKIAHLIQLKGKSFMFAADSNNIEPKLYERIFELAGPVDVLFLGMECDGAPLTWLYGPLLSRPLDRKMDQSRRLSGSDFPKAARIVDQLKCKEVYVYAMGQEPWLTYIMSIKYTEQSNPIVESNKLVEDCLRRGITSERLFGKKELFYN